MDKLHNITLIKHDVILKEQVPSFLPIFLGTKFLSELDGRVIESDISFRFRFFNFAIELALKFTWGTV